MTDLPALWEAYCSHWDHGPADGRAVLPRLAELREPEAVVLAAAVVANGGDEVRAEHARDIATLLATANELLPETREDYEFLLEAVLVLEGLLDRTHVLASGVADEEYEVECPECGTPMSILTGKGVSRTGNATRPLRPAELDGVGRKAYETASAHGRDDTARVFRFFFGQATCPACDAGLTISDELLPAS
ncbi:hypothetical protein PV646_25025 [Streptomyces sp. ID05-26A]|nr:hypothetical protein [Streptomyces sp. ID05-26A]